MRPPRARSCRLHSKEMSWYRFKDYLISVMITRQLINDFITKDVGISEVRAGCDTVARKTPPRLLDFRTFRCWAYWMAAFFR